MAGHPLTIQSLAFHPSGERLVSVSFDGSIRFWDISPTGGGESKIFLKGRALATEFISRIALSPDGRWFAGDATSEALTIIDLQEKKHLLTLPTERSPITSICWSPDSKRVAVGLADGGVSIWDMENVKKQLTEINLGWK